MVGILKLVHPTQIVRSCNFSMTTVKYGGHVRLHNWWGPEKNQGREVVGFGVKGDEYYEDRVDYWYPAVRFRRNDEVVTPIREKELSDWKQLSIDEKKMLYRYSFCQTLAEYEAPEGYEKISIAIFFAIAGISILYGCFLQRFFYPPMLPTQENEYKESVIEKRLVLEKGRFIGPAAYYDYENNRWKD
ncbi:Cytochrome-c oxidase [Meloidogyne graminicola]|uniref:Cytochrome c oxidase subunit 4 n=1 Tax=Meloidogyne graminicola TaxID=189291 RepID=A0A8S9Z6K2_9BILA|nr:Cytochrome-c oxidase [Meloidogyne graminicola]